MQSDLSLKHGLCVVLVYFDERVSRNPSTGWARHLWPKASKPSSNFNLTHFQTHFKTQAAATKFSSTPPFGQGVGRFRPSVAQALGKNYLHFIIITLCTFYYASVHRSVTHACYYQQNYHDYASRRSCGLHWRGPAGHGGKSASAGRETLMSTPSGDIRRGRRDRDPRD